MKEFIFVIILATIALFARTVMEAKSRKAYLVSKLEYCQQLVVAYWTNDPKEIKYAEKLWFYGCTRSDDIK